ncbi:lipid II flippase MurJ [subsurface metagenome]
MANPILLAMVSGRLIRQVLALITVPILVRYITVAEYGLLTLGNTLLGIFTLLAVLGLPQGVTRYIAHHHSGGDSGKEKIIGIISTSICFPLMISILLAIVSFFASDSIALFFHNPGLSLVVKIFAISIPIVALIDILVSIFRGFKIPEVPAFAPVLRGSLWLLFLVMVILIGLPFVGVLWASIAAALATLLLIASYARRKKIPLSIKRYDNPIAKELLVFSLPLFGTGVVNNFLRWLGPLFLGYLAPMEAVGLYNAAFGLGIFTFIFRDALALMYLPVISELHATVSQENLKRIYATMSRWLLILTLPIFFLLFLFSNAAVSILYGSPYLQSCGAVQIIAVALLAQVASGPCGMNLIAMGKTRFLMWSALVGLGVNITLSVILIPRMSFMGAAIAFSAASIIVQGMNWVKLFSTSSIHPVSKSYLKIWGIATTLTFLGWIVMHNLGLSLVWSGIAFITLLMTYSLLILVTKSLEIEDVSVVSSIERKMFPKGGPIEKILTRFLPRDKG